MVYYINTVCLLGFMCVPLSFHFRKLVFKSMESLYFTKANELLYVGGHKKAPGTGAQSKNQS
jgi:hypothetical protein